MLETHISRYEKNKTVMINLWQQIAAIADFDKNGEVDTEEFMGGVETACKGKSYDDLPEAFKFFIEAQFRTIDVDGKFVVQNGVCFFIQAFIFRRWFNWS